MPEVLTAVIDSTVLVSAFLTEGEASAELLRYAREGVFLVFLSEDILTETEHTLYSVQTFGFTHPSHGPFLMVPTKEFKAILLLETKAVAAVTWGIMEHTLG